MTYLSVFCTNMAATIDIVVGNEAAHTPCNDTCQNFSRRLKRPFRDVLTSRFKVRSSMPLATMSGGAHWKQAVTPGSMSWMWPLIASSDTPDSIHGWFNSTQAWITLLIYICSFIPWGLLVPDWSPFVPQNCPHSRARDPLVPRSNYRAATVDKSVQNVQPRAMRLIFKIDRVETTLVIL